MKITAVETCWTRIPFDMGGKPATTGGLNWQSMNTVWLRIVTDQGLEGWGEAFGQASAATTITVIDTQLAPAILGQDARDIGRQGGRARWTRTWLRPGHGCAAPVPGRRTDGPSLVILHRHVSADAQRSYRDQA